MTFFEEGKFLLDDPISKYIPAFKNPVVLVSYDTLHPATGEYKTRPAKSELPFAIFWHIRPVFLTAIH
jgi:hypothetical protein